MSTYYNKILGGKSNFYSGSYYFIVYFIIMKMRRSFNIMNDVL